MGLSLCQSVDSFDALDGDEPVARDLGKALLMVSW